MKRWDFNSLSDFVRACRALPDELTDRRNSLHQRKWAGEPYRESLRLASSGGTKENVPAAEAMLSQIHASLPETSARRWALDYAGAFPCVPAYLAGEPENMWAPTDTPTDTNPVRVYVCTTSSCAIKADQLMRRGCAVLALVMLASRSRPVELYSFNHCAEQRENGRGDAFLVQRLQSSPLMLSEVAYVLTSAGWARNLTYAFVESRLGDAFGVYGSASHDHAATRNLLGLEPQDVLIGPALKGDPLIVDPVGFVHRELSKLNLTTE